MANQEADDVRERYARRANTVNPRRYSMLSADVWQTVQERQRAMLSLFVELGIDDLSNLRLLEVGTGFGGNLLELLRIGFSPENLLGIELLPERADMARRMLPEAVQITTGDATTVPVPAESLDFVYQSVVFSSLLDDAFQSRLATVIWGWIKPGGGVLWYDFVYNNPANPDVRGVPLSRVRELFPRGVIDARRVTLAPPIARRVTRVHPSLYSLFNVLPILRTHVLCWIQKQ